MDAPKLRWVALGAVMSFAVAVMLVSLFREMKKIDALSATLDERMAQFVEEERTGQELKRKIKYYNTPEGMARLAAEKFNMVASGERLYKIEVVGGTTSGDATPNSNQ